MSIQCFMIEPVQREKYALRRYGEHWIDEQPGIRMRFSPPCAGRLGFHNANVFLGERPLSIEHGSGSDSWPHDDPRWPTICESCSYEFLPEDQWQLWTEQIYRDPRNGQEMTLREAPAGAMWWWPYLHDKPEVWLILPNGAGFFCVAQQAKGGGYWTCTGTAPAITLTPSINAEGVWHGFLTNGELVG